MDINRLLSPDENGSRPAPSPPQQQQQQQPSVTSMPSPRKRRPAAGAGGKPKQSNLSNEVRRSPEHMDMSGHSSPAQGYSVSPRQQQQQYYQSPANFRPQLQPQVPQADNRLSSGYIQAQTQPARPPLPHRHSSQSSTHSTTAVRMDRDLPAVRRQNEQFYNNTNRESGQTRPSPPVLNPNPTVTPPLSRGQSLADIAMADAPAQTPPPRTFTSSALTETESQTVTGLLSHLSQRENDYASLLQLINLLHKGFVTHSNAPGQDPRTFGLLSELRQARDSMNSRFAVGEEIWQDWLLDEVVLAQSSDERIAVADLFDKALTDEPSSVLLWLAYINWFQATYAACNNFPDADQSGWTEDDKEICAAFFTKDMLIGVFTKAIAATSMRIDQGHHIWNRYIQVIQPEDLNQASEDDLKMLQEQYVERLRIPSAGWDETAQLFSPVVNRLYGNDWEAVAIHLNEIGRKPKTQIGLREELELNLSRAIESGDKNEEFNQFTNYINFEFFRKFKKNAKITADLPYSHEIRAALYERALLRFPTYTEWWLDYVDFVISLKPSSHDPSSSVLPLLERAVRHCPWSGDLWARRILRADVERKAYGEIAQIKHTATNSCLLDVGGLEELVKVLVEWCSYLRRTAFTSTSSHDDLDTAEVGMTSALEDVNQAGRKIYGPAFAGDPLYRLERIQMKFFAEARRIDEARKVWQTLVPQQSNSFEFWQRYYSWEILFWGHDRLSDNHRIETTETAPHLATHVVESMLSQKNLDQPESAVELYMSHFQQHESVEKLQAAGIEAREFLKRIANLRKKQAKEAAAAAPEQPVLPPAPLQAAEATEATTGNKRQREEEPDEAAQKKSRADDAELKQAKRDRENSTITVTNLDPAVTEKDLNDFFSDCGTINEIKMVPAKANVAAAATIEFGEAEDVLTAKTRGGKTLKGREIQVQSGTRSTLWVTNYPPKFHEADIRKIFEGFGDIVSIRLPSLKYDQRRNFCYVQFLNGEQAQAASDAVNGKAIDSIHKLVALISDPSIRKERSGHLVEGREITIMNIAAEVSDDDFKKFFSKYGTVQRVNILGRVEINHNGIRRAGKAFVVYSTAAEATKAVTEANNKPLGGCLLHVEMAQVKGRVAPMERARHAEVVVKHSDSPEPTGTGNGTDPAADGNIRRGSDVSMASASGPVPSGERVIPGRPRERQAGVLKLPDTVSDARIQAEMEKHGNVVRMILKRDRRAAIVEFDDLQTAFSVRQGVDCSALGEGVYTSTTDEIFSEEYNKPNKKPAAFGGMRPSTLKRPGQPGQQRKGGLGSQRHGLGLGFTKQSEGSASSAGSSSGAKSNADFRAMFEQSREAAAKPAEEKQDGRAKEE